MAGKLQLLIRRNIQETMVETHYTALFEKGAEVFGSIESFRRWMNKPVNGLGEQIPSELLNTSGGIELIMDELTRIEFGDLA